MTVLPNHGYKIIIVGPPGAGKNTVGEVLKKDYGLKVLDIDDYVIDVYKAWPNTNEKVYRMFKECYQAVCEREQIILLTSYMSRQDVREMLVKGFIIFALKCDLRTLIARKTHRDGQIGNLADFKKDNSYFIRTLQEMNRKGYFASYLNSKNNSPQQLAEIISKNVFKLNKAV